MTLNLLVRNVARNLNGSLRRLPNNLYNASLNSRNIIRNVYVTSPVLKNSDVHVTFVRANGEKLPVTAKVGDSLLDAVVDSGLDLDGYGACEGTLTCSTCHVILDKGDFNRIGEKPVDEELDMLDLAHGLTDTSRLGCQIILTAELDGLHVHLPASINDARK